MTHDTTILPPVTEPRAHRRRSFRIRDWAEATDCARFFFWAEAALGLAVILGLAAWRWAG